MQSRTLGCTGGVGGEAGAQRQRDADGALGNECVPCNAVHMSDLRGPCKIENVSYEGKL